ncbi:hypothetical protein L6452_20561 [Arctium lappa]|uniref:Uncharacterized protein n=1 Tax=Arctium lappa TaxID=4217 RepID=A0ACB9BB98_ARCLA|nr:hypothetical protein L6452_20561 [Arctium lappa]
MEQQREREKRSDDEREMENDGERRTLDRQCEKAGEATVPKARREKKKSDGTISPKSHRFLLHLLLHVRFLLHLFSMVESVTIGRAVGASRRRKALNPPSSSANP